MQDVEHFRQKWNARVSLQRAPSLFSCKTFYTSKYICPSTMKSCNCRGDTSMAALIRSVIVPDLQIKTRTLAGRVRVRYILGVLKKKCVRVQTQFTRIYWSGGPRVSGLKSYKCSSFNLASIICSPWPWEWRESFRHCCSSCRWTQNDASSPSCWSSSRQQRLSRPDRSGPGCRGAEMETIIFEEWSKFEKEQH